MKKLKNTSIYQIKATLFSNVVKFISTGMLISEWDKINISKMTMLYKLFLEKQFEQGSNSELHLHMDYISKLDEKFLSDNKVTVSKRACIT